MKVISKSTLAPLIMKNQEDSQTPRKYYPSPSKVGQCIRALTYHCIGLTPKKFSGRAIGVFDDGRMHEIAIKEKIRGTVYELTEWQGKKHRFDIAEIHGKEMTGEIDGLLTDPTGQIIALEIKTINHFGYNRLIEEPDEKNFRQAISSAYPCN